jgi:hypothetical protein
LKYDKLNYDDLFRRRFDTGVELNYSFNDNLQTFGRLGYESFDGRTRRAAFFTPDSGEPGVALRAHFADEDSKSLELGSRYFWPTGTPWEPYAGVSLGATRLDATSADFSTADGGIDLHIRDPRPSSVRVSKRASNSTRTLTSVCGSVWMRITSACRRVRTILR